MTIHARYMVYKSANVSSERSALHGVDCWHGFANALMANTKRFAVGDPTSDQKMHRKTEVKFINMIPIWDKPKKTVTFSRKGQPQGIHMQL